MKSIRVFSWIIICFFLVITFYIYKAWFFPGFITAGDFWPTYKELYGNSALVPSVWNPLLKNGFGGNASFLLWNYFFFSVPMIIGKYVSVNFEILERAAYFFPYLFLSILSAFIWVRYFFKNILSQVLGVFIYTLNTYILMVVLGGQLGIAFAYAVAPLTMVAFLAVFEQIYLSAKKQVFSKQLLHKTILAGLALAFQINFDLRIAYVTSLGMILILLLKAFYNRAGNIPVKIVMLRYFSILGAFCIAILLHAFWIVPFSFQGKTDALKTVGDAYTSLQSVRFFSFTNFYQALSLLHPNWPENIFGKVSFMKPEFLLIPILGFSSLFVLDKKYKNIPYIIGLFLLVCLGSFLAKGANAPFGEFYLWCFTYIPGFFLFRDSMKFYLLVSLAYAILIPYLLEQLFTVKKRFTLSVVSYSIVFLYLSFLIFPAINGNLNGISKTTQVPNEYIKLKDRLIADKTFSRVLWIPDRQRFEFSSDMHPAVSAQTLFNTTDRKKLLAIIQGKQKGYENIQQRLINLKIGYIVVPYDSEKEIFLTDRKYDNSYANYIRKAVGSISWLEKESGFKNLVFYKLAGKTAKFTSEKNEPVQYTKQTLTSYRINISSRKTIIYAESYDPGWIAEKGNITIASKPTQHLFNSFSLAPGDYEVSYQPQMYLLIGVCISSVTLFMSVLLIIFTNYSRIKGKYLYYSIRIKREL